MPPETFELDLSFITDPLVAAGPLVLVAVGVVFAAGLAVGLVIWAGPKLVGLFKRNAR